MPSSNFTFSIPFRFLFDTCRKTDTTLPLYHEKLLTVSTKTLPADCIDLDANTKNGANDGDNNNNENKDDNNNHNTNKTKL